MVAAVIRATGDWTLAEDAAQEAFEKAAARWATEGVPARPGAWLTTVARNAAVDQLRRRTTESRKLEEVAIEAALTGENGRGSPADHVTQGWDDEPDDRLRLIFTCAHPALEIQARVALTLRTVGGLTTGEIARAFLVPEATVAQRIVRAKRRIAHAGIPYRVPGADQLPERRDGVLAVLYLVFTEGHSATSGETLERVDLAIEAIRLARLVVEIMPRAQQDEPRALLALMLLQHSRRDTRVDAAGELVPLEEQDRRRWDRGAIDEAVGLLRAPGLERGGYRVQAEIAAEHATAASGETTDWVRIVRLYDELADATSSPVVALNRAIAIGMSRGPDAGLAELRRIEVSGALEGYHLLPAAQADLLRRARRDGAAAERYDAAIALAPTLAERRYLQRRRAALAL